jgi:hypothetical protein
VAALRKRAGGASEHASRRGRERTPEPSLPHTCRASASRPGRSIPRAAPRTPTSVASSGRVEGPSTAPAWDPGVCDPRRLPLLDGSPPRTVVNARPLRFGNSARLGGPTLFTRCSIRRPEERESQVLSRTANAGSAAPDGPSDAGERTATIPPRPAPRPRGRRSPSTPLPNFPLRIRRPRARRSSQPPPTRDSVTRGAEPRQERALHTFATRSSDRVYHRPA